MMTIALNALLAAILFVFSIACTWHAWVTRNDARDPANSQGRR